MLYLKNTKTIHPMTNVFLLGGHDLEMLTIKEILDDYKVKYYDRNLSWDTAFLREYSDVLDALSTDAVTIYGIELKDDGAVLPKNYISIDHHDKKEDGPSSLEQVCELLGVEMNRRLQLISANDKAYIPGMVALKATVDEISEIRQLDRQAQGVNEQEELEAEKAIKEAYYIHGLLCIKAYSKHFSPIIDRVYRKSLRTLVYTDNEFAYYGWGRSIILEKLKEQFPAIDFYHGGGGNGYFGAGLLGCVKEIINTIITMDTIYSEHIFMFPFICDFSTCHNDVLSSFQKMHFSKEGYWERVLLTQEDDKKPDVYNEKNYFYPVAHDVIYDMGSKSHIRHFERIEPKMETKEVSFVIKVANDVSYTLRINKIHLNLYSTGVGVLSVFAENHDYPEKQQVLEINQFGRRLFPPYRADVKLHRQTPLSLGISGLELSKSMKDGGRDYVADYTNDDALWIPNTPAPFVVELIQQASKDIHNIQPIHDDRMFVMSWYKFGDHEFKSEEGFNTLISEQDSFLYQYIFIDHNGPSCVNLQMRKRILEESIYARWQGQGTLYGVSRYSFVMLTTPGCPEFLLRYFETEYERMAEMVLVQRASILRFSNLIKKALDAKGLGFNSYYQQYISFLNRFRLPEISAQDQALELYELLCQKIRIKENADDLDRQFNELQEFLELKSQRGLNQLAAWAVPASVTTAFFTFFFHDSFDNGTLPILPEHSGMIWLLVTIVATVIVIFVIRRRNQ